MKPDTGRKSRVLPTLSAFNVPEYCRHVWSVKTRMVWLPDGKQKLNMRLLVLAESTNVSDGHTDRHRMTAKAALLYRRAAKITLFLSITEDNYRKEIYLVVRYMAANSFSFYKA